MSSAGASGGAAAIPAAETPSYFCHECTCTAFIDPSPEGDIFCPFCGGGFVEELDNPPPPPNPNPNPNTIPASVFSFQGSYDPFFPPPAAAATAGPLPFIFSPGAASYDIRDLETLLNTDHLRPHVAVPAAGPEPFNPLAFLQNHIQSLISGGANIQVVLEGGGGGLGLGGNLGDYFVGPGLEQLIQQLAENDPNRYGTPPASKSAIQSLPDIIITESILSDDEAQCAVCKDPFELGAVAKQMPCKHIYHKDCILPWLELHNSCPVCRYELPTDDQDYERARGGGSGAGDAAQGGRLTGDGRAGSGSGDGNESPWTRMVERRFRISLPWTLRTNTQAEASNARGRANSSDGQGGRDAGSGGQGGTGSESRSQGDSY